MNDDLKSRAELLEELRTLRTRLAERPTEAASPRSRTPSVAEIFHEVLSNVPMSLFFMNDDGVATRSLGMGLRRYGLDEHGMIGIDIFEAFPHVEGQVVKALTGEVAEFVDSGMIDGEPWYAQNYFLPSELGGTIHVSFDVTQLKKAEEAVTARADRLQFLLDHAPDAFLLTDLDGRIRDANARMCRSLGYERDELLRLTIPDIDVDWTRERVGEASRRLVPGVPETEQGRQRRRDGTTFPVEIRAGAVEKDGRTLVFSLIRDLSEELVRR